ncbi:MAG: adenine deaminase [Candidatus Brockarchaeota archaeon]|nr:adenine deaminase [Candidatus Brockarchaeota archaeon]
MGKAKADLVVKKATLVNVETGELIPDASVSVSKGYVADVGDLPSIGPETRVIDGSKAFAIPGFLDGHVHVESSMLSLTNFSFAALERGTTGVFVDPHEIANVLGPEGVRLLIRESLGLPIKIFFLVPSCVPAVPGMETSGASMSASDVAELLRESSVVGLAEVMNYPGVVSGEAKLLREMRAALRLGKVVDGHYAGKIGKELAAYVSSGASSCHESVSREEALAKARLGMYLMVREGSAFKNLSEVIKVVTMDKIYPCKVLLVSDDRDAPSLAKEGHMDFVVKRAVEEGVDPVLAIQMATINVARRFRVDDFAGSIAPGKCADIVLVEDLKSFKIKSVVSNGKLLVHGGKLLASRRRFRYPERSVRTVKFKRRLHPADFVAAAPADRGESEAHVILVRDGESVTKHVVEVVPTAGGAVLPDLGADILRVSVVERHGKTGNVANGLVKGFGLREGAVATSVSHDSHNLTVVGVGASDMHAAANEVRRMGGGISVVARGKVVAKVALPIAGLMSLKPLRPLNADVERVKSALKKLGCQLESPFMALSFLSLSVIPEIRITDKGIVDVLAFSFIPLLARGN